MELWWYLFTLLVDLWHGIDNLQTLYNFLVNKNTTVSNQLGVPYFSMFN